MIEMKEYKKGDKWINFMGHELRIIGKVDNYLVLRYKGAYPFIKSISEMPKFLEFIQAKNLNQ